MKTHAERQAAAAAERQRIAGAYEAEQEAARAIIQDAAKARAADTEYLEARIAREDDEARGAVCMLGDERLRPLVAALHGEANNNGTVALIEAVKAADAIALGGTGEPYPLRRVALLLAELHRQSRPAILEHLTAPRAWHSRSGGGLGGTEFAQDLRNAIERHDVAGARATFEKFDAALWSLTQKPVDGEALSTWLVTLEPNPAVLRQRQAELAEREREAQTAATEAGCLAAVKHGGAKLGWPKTTGVSYQ